MLTIIVGEEGFNEATQEFEVLDPVELTLEHSLVSLSKWESKFSKPFLATTDKTPEEIIGYIEAMTISSNFSLDVYSRLSKENLNSINDYIGSPQSATTFSEYSDSKRGQREIVTSELIYFWMDTLGVSWKAENWHLNRLFALLRIHNIKNSKQKKMSKQEIASRNRALNEQRKAQLGTTG